MSSFFFFFAFDNFRQVKGEDLYKKNYAMKNKGHPARSRAKEHCACLHGPFIEKQYRVLGMCALTCLIT